MRKDFMDFPLSKNEKYGLSARCRSCIGLYYQANRETILHKVKTRYDPVRKTDYDAKYHASQPWRKSENSQLRYYADVEKSRELLKIRRLAEPEKARDHVAKWKKRYPQKVNVMNANRRAMKNGAKGKHSVNDMVDLMNAQKNRCAHSWCLAFITFKTAHKDHRIPLKLGGSNDKGNMQWLCIPCNLSKGASHPVDFAARHGVLV